MSFRVPAVGVVLYLLLGVATTTATPTVGATGCITVAYTTDYNSNISTIAGNGSVMIGSDLTVISDCGDFVVYLDGIQTVGAEKMVTMRIPQGEHSIDVRGQNWSVQYIDITVFPGSGEWINENYESEEDMIKVQSKDLLWDEIFAHAVTAAILFILSTTVVYRVAQWRVDRTAEVVI